MQTTFDDPFGHGITEAVGAPHDDTLVVMRTEDGGLELLGEDVTLHLSLDDLRTLFFYSSTVELEGSGGVTAAIGVDPRRHGIVLMLEGRSFRAPRWAITAVVRGRLHAAYLRVDRRRTRFASALAAHTLG